jgi:hypothetical protein
MAADVNFRCPVAGMTVCADRVRGGTTGSASRSRGRSRIGVAVAADGVGGDSIKSCQAQPYNGTSHTSQRGAWDMDAAEIQAKATIVAALITVARWKCHRFHRSARGGTTRPAYGCAI